MKMIHSMIRVLNVDKSLKFYKAGFDLNVKNRYEFDGFDLIYLSNKNSYFELELTYNYDQTKPYNLGNGYGHLAFSTDNIEEEYNKFKKIKHANPTDLITLEKDSKPFARFFFVTDPDGYSIEILERNGRFV